MPRTKPFYERNPILESPCNVTFEELLAMTKEQFSDWVKFFRSEVVRCWDEYGTPCRTGSTEQEIVDSFNQLAMHNISKFTRDDELTPDDPGTVIYNGARAGTEVDQWFPNMMKVPINYTESNDGHSVYDMLKGEEFHPRMVKGSWRHLRNDSFYYFSRTVRIGDKSFPFHHVKTGVEWIEEAFKNPKAMVGQGYWIQEVEEDSGPSSGYVQVRQSDFYTLTKLEVEGCVGRGIVPTLATANIPKESKKKNPIYTIRLYDLGQRVFPHCFQAIKIGYISVPTNFPPMTAKYLWQRYTNHLVGKQDRIIVYDPSSGWGGRILGAMAVSDDRCIHYVGTDPNPDNVWGGKTQYENIAEFFNTRTARGLDPFGVNPANTYDVFQEGSEEIRHHPRFQQYRGNIDMVFTSPPYFSREMYSSDPKQSAVKFGSSYESWRDGFLQPTLETCVEWMKPGGYLLWNIADVLVPRGYLPLEQDSKDVLNSLGMEYVTTLKMAMASMPGGQRLDENGIPKCKNYMKVDGKYLKYEPIMVYRKP